MSLQNVTFINAGFCTATERMVGGPSRREIQFFAVFVYFEHPDHGACLIDAGYSEHFYTATASFPERFFRWLTPVTLPSPQNAEGVLRARGIDTKSINKIFVSHFHADHIGGLRHFKQARYVYREQALAHLWRQGRWRRTRHGFLTKLLPDDFESRGEIIREEQFKVGGEGLLGLSVVDYWGDDSLLLVDLPGHADGHTGYVLRTKETDIFYVVDACWHLDVMLEERPLPWLSRSFQFDLTAYMDTQQQLRTIADNRGYCMLACHCPRTQDYIGRYSESTESIG